MENITEIIKKLNEAIVRLTGDNEYLLRKNRQLKEDNILLYNDLQKTKKKN